MLRRQEAKRKVARAVADSYDLETFKATVLAEFNADLATWQRHYERYTWWRTRGIVAFGVVSCLFFLPSIVFLAIMGALTLTLHPDQVPSFPKLVYTIAVCVAVLATGFLFLIGFLLRATAVLERTGFWRDIHFQAKDQVRNIKNAKDQGDVEKAEQVLQTLRERRRTDRPAGEEADKALARMEFILGWVSSLLGKGSP